MNRDDRELVARIVDQVERGIRRDDLTGRAGEREAERRFAAACPWHEIETPRERSYRREAKTAMARLFATGGGSVVVDVDAAARLAGVPELERWARRRGVELTQGGPPVVGYPKPAPAGSETIDMFAQEDPAS